MAYDLEEQESIDQMKAWWDRWGTPVTSVVCVCCLAFAGWNGWNWWQRNQAAKASQIYAALQNAVATHDLKNVQSLSAGLISEYSSTLYAPLAAFASAQSASDAGDLADAKAKLNWVIEKSGRPEYDTVARVRLAGVLFDEGKLDEAAAVLAAAKTKRYPMARLRRMVLAAWLDLPAPPERAPYLRVLAANDTGRRLLRQMRDAGAPVLTKPADVSLLGAEAEALFAVESRCTDLYVLARPDPAQMTPGQEWRMTPVMR